MNYYYSNLCPSLIFKEIKDIKEYLTQGSLEIVSEEKTTDKYCIVIQLKNTKDSKHVYSFNHLKLWKNS